MYLSVLLYLVGVLQAETVGVETKDLVDAHAPKSPVQFSSEFLKGQVRLLPRVRQAFLASKDESVIQKMNQYLESCTPRQQDMFIEMINETTPPVISGKAFLHKIVDQAIILTGMTKSNNWLAPEQSSSFVSSLGSSFRSLFSHKSKKEQRIEELFRSALTGDEDSVENIHRLAETKTNLSQADKQKILDNLQLQAAELLEEINKEVPTKNKEAQDRFPDDLMRQGEAMREIGQQQEANARAVIKYSKDVLRALRPMCNHDQHLIHIVDRTTLAPVLNIIDFKDFPLGSVRSQDELSNFIKEKVQELHAQGKLHIPLHHETKPKFIESIQKAVLSHHPDIKLPAHTAYESIASSPERDVAVVEHLRKLDSSVKQRWMREHVQEKLSKLIDRKGFANHRDQIVV